MVWLWLKQCWEQPIISNQSKCNLKQPNQIQATTRKIKCSKRKERINMWQQDSQYTLKTWDRKYSISSLKHADTKLSLALYNHFWELHAKCLTGFVFHVLLMLTKELRHCLWHCLICTMIIWMHLFPTYCFRWQVPTPTASLQCHS